jgi:serine/threonine-protein kinase SRPK3
VWWSLALTKYTSTNKFAALKIFAHDYGAVENQTAIYKRLSTAGDPEHPGRMYVRKIQDSFSVTSTAGNTHQCLVHEVLFNDLSRLRLFFPERKLHEACVRYFLLHLLLALDFLHRVCHIIHTGQATPHYALENIDRMPAITESNILVGLIDPSILNQLDAKEIKGSVLCKRVKGYNIYTPVHFGFAKFGSPILCNFTHTSNEQVERCHNIQRYDYRAPEVILDIPWGYAVDIWNVGVMVRDFLHVTNSTIHRSETNESF